MSTTSLGRLTLDLIARTAGFTDGMSRAERAADNWRRNVERNAKIATAALTGAAAAVGAGMVAMVKSQLQAADEASKMAQRIGVATEQIAGLSLAFELGGSDAAGMQTAMVKLADQAAAGSKAFEALGVSTVNAQGRLKDTRTLIGEVADAFAAMPDGANKTALAVDLFGKSGAQIIPILNAGAKGFADMDAQAQALGLTLSTQAGKDIEAFNDRVSMMFKRMEGFGLQLTVAVLPYLHAVMDAVEQLAEFIGSHLNEILLAGGAAFAAFASQAGLVSGAISTIAKTFKATAALFMTNPFALVIAAVAALVIYFGKAEEALYTIKTVAGFVADFMSTAFKVAADVVSSVFSWLLEKLARDWQQIVDVVSDVYNWITDSTSTSTSAWSADYQGFFDDTGSGFFGILEKAAKVFDSIGALVRACMIYVGELMGALFTKVGKIWDNIKAVILNKVEGFINGIVDGINAVADALGMKSLNKVSLGGGPAIDTSVDMPEFGKIYETEAARQAAQGMQAAVQAMEEKMKAAKESAKETEKTLGRLAKPTLGVLEEATDSASKAARGAGRAAKAAKSAADSTKDAMKALEEAARQIEEAQNRYQQLVEQLETPDEKRLRTLREQLAVIQEMQRHIDNGIAGAPSQAGLDETKKRALAAAMQGAEMPKYGGLDTSIGGAFGEFDKIGKAREELLKWQEEQLTALDNQLAVLKEHHGLMLEEERLFEEKRAEIKAQAREQERVLQEATYMASLSAGEELFGQLTSMAKQYAGEQSGIYRAMFALQKSFAIAKSIIAIKEGIALAAANPWPKNLAAMASVAAATGSIVSTIAGVAMPSGMAHDGIDKIPKTGTWLLEKGERVTTAKTSAKLDATLSQIQKNQQNQSQATAQNIRIVNVMDAAVVGGYLGSDAGEKLIMNVISNNRNAIKQTIES